MSELKLRMQDGEDVKLHHDFHYYTILNIRFITAASLHCQMSQSTFADVTCLQT